MWHEMALSSEGWQAGLGGGTLLRSEENFAGGRQSQSLEGMSAESEEDVTQEKDAGGAVANSVMGEDEGAVRLLMEQYSAEERSLIGSERRIYLFGDLLLPLGRGRCNHAEGMRWPVTR